MNNNTICESFGNSKKVAISGNIVMNFKTVSIIYGSLLENLLLSGCAKFEIPKDLLA
jgi:hypothetical protein